MYTLYELPSGSSCSAYRAPHPIMARSGSACLSLTPDAVVARLATELALQLAPFPAAAAWLLMLDVAVAALLLS